AKRADPRTVVEGQPLAVVWNLGCGRDRAQCIDLDRGLRLASSFVMALDVTKPAAAPIEIDAIDTAALPGFPRRAQKLGEFTPLYFFRASDDIVAFRIPELGVDLNGDGRDGLLRSRAFDLNLRRVIAAAEDSPR